MKNANSMAMVLVIAMLFAAACSTDTAATEAPATEATAENATEAPGTETATEAEEETEEDTETAEELPTLGIGYMFSNHQTPLIVAAAKNEAFQSEGAYLKEVLPREKYILNDGEKDIANIDVVVAQNGGEVMTMLTQGQLQMGIASIGLPLTTIDKGHDMKVLGPIHTDGIALVMEMDSPLEGYEDFLAYVEEHDGPVKVGYHSPANAPVILFTQATTEQGLVVTESPEETDADILLVNLKGTANLIPSLLSKEVDAFIGPSPFPELAKVEESGKIIFDLRDLPPEGEWHNFPCCVFSANTDTLNAEPEVIEAFYEVLTTAANFANENKEETGKIVADWMGVNEEAASNTITHFTTNADEDWLRNVEVTFDSLQGTGNFEGSLKDKAFDEIKDQVIDLSIEEKIHP